jgi:hypothetical protein
MTADKKIATQAFAGPRYRARSFSQCQYHGGNDTREEFGKFWGLNYGEKYWIAGSSPAMTAVKKDCHPGIYRAALLHKKFLAMGVMAKNVC